MTPEIYQRARPWLCALPSTDLSPINVNTLSVEQAPLLVMLAPDQIGIDEARRVIANRPTAGWGNLVDFYSEPGLEDVVLPVDIQLQPQVRTRWFALDLRIDLPGAELREAALVRSEEQTSELQSLKRV